MCVAGKITVETLLSKSHYVLTIMKKLEKRGGLGVMARERHESRVSQ